MDYLPKKDQCKFDIETAQEIREDLPEIVEQIVQTCTDKDYFSHLGPETIPSRDTVIDVIQRFVRILYPGYFIDTYLDEVNIEYYLGQEVTELFELLARQITLAIQHDCLRYNQPCSQCLERGHRSAVRLIQEIPRLRVLLANDVRATYDGDPAAKTYDEVIFCYPGLFAMTVYRVAHKLFTQEIPLIPRIMTEYAHMLTGIDIHPGANIDESFFIDHGTGVVIGETTEIGKRVRIYQGVTLGALSLQKNEVEELRNKKRHPTIEDDVIIYAGATILGGSTVIGARSIVGGNIWITESIPPDTEVFLSKPELVFRKLHTQT